MPLNSHYLILFNNLRDRSQIKYLSRQIRPSNTRYIDTKTHGYILFDLRQQTPEILRLKSNFFQESGEPMVFYVKRTN